MGKNVTIIFLVIFVSCILISQRMSIAQEPVAEQIAGCEECDSRFVNATSDTINKLKVKQRLDVNGNIVVRNIASGKPVSASNWGQTTPSDLSKAVDSKEGTSTTEGITVVAGNEGFITVDLGTVYKGLVYVKMGVRMVTGASAHWRIWSSVDNSQWIINWDSQRMYPGNTEVLWYPAIPFWGRYIRVSAYDIGEGQVGLKVYEIYVKPYQ